jgi:hypothetical protein
MEGPAPGARRALAPVAHRLQEGDMRRLGTRRTGAIGRWFNRAAERSIRFRREVYGRRFAELLEENGPRVGSIELVDGWAIDESRALPYLDAILADGAELIEAYGGRKWEHEKPYLQNINPEEAIERHPALLDFVTSSDVLAAVAPCFGYVPILSGLLPRGVRLMESSTTFDPDAAGPWRESQLYHLDYHASPTVYVIVALRDIAPADGPLHFLGRAASGKVAEALDYGARGVPYRLTDEQVYAIVDESEVHRFVAQAGTVLILESSACLHFGSRQPANPRYQMQYAFVSPVRNDFLALWLPQRVYPISPSDSRLRRLVLHRASLELDGPVRS